MYAAKPAHYLLFLQTGLYMPICPGLWEMANQNYERELTALTSSIMYFFLFFISSIVFYQVTMLQGLSFIFSMAGACWPGSRQ